MIAQQLDALRYSETLDLGSVIEVCSDTKSFGIHQCFDCSNTPSQSLCKYKNHDIQIYFLGPSWIARIPPKKLVFFQLHSHSDLDEVPFAGVVRQDLELVIGVRTRFHVDHCQCRCVQTAVAFQNIGTILCNTKRLVKLRSRQVVIRVTESRGVGFLRTLRVGVGFFIRLRKSIEWIFISKCSLNK